MKTHQSSTGLAFTERATGIESAKFHDGMIVAADDLETASRYPVSLLQSVLRAYLGCGVVCGLQLSTPQKLPHEPVWGVTIDRGLAVDCRGFPIELACPVELDLTPDPCSREDLPQRVTIAIRRITSDEATTQPCSCAQHQSDDDCNRVRDRALVTAFTDEQLVELSGGICGDHKNHDTGCINPNANHDGSGGGASTQNADAEKKREEKKDEKKEDEEVVDATDWCASLKQCGCSCNGDWVLLGSVDLIQGEGLGQGQKKGVGNIHLEERRWVKPTEAACALERRQQGLHDHVTTLEKQVKELLDKVNSLQNPPLPG